MRPARICVSCPWFSPPSRAGADGERVLAQHKRTFHTHERAAGDVDAYSLVRDGDTGEVYILHEWSQLVGGRPVHGSARLDLDGFLLDGGDPQQRLRALIGTLVPG